jgi:streptogramin lyase
MRSIQAFSVFATALTLHVSAAPALLERDTSRFTYYDMTTPLIGPCDLAVGPDGALWGQGILVDTFFRVDPATGRVDEFPIPFTTPLSSTVIPISGVPKAIGDRTALSCAIREGSDGNIYAGNGLRNQLVRINPGTKKIDIFSVTPVDPLGNLFFFNDLYSAEDGIWTTSTTANTFSFFSFATEKFTTYTVPTPAAIPIGIFVASNKIVYIAELLGNKILKFDPSTKVTTEYPVPELLQSPNVIRAEHDGWVYFTIFTGNGLGRINMVTNEIELYHTNQPGFSTTEDTIDKYGGVWAASISTNIVARLDTSTFQYNYVPLPFTLASAGIPGIAGDVPPYTDIAINYGPGDAIWFTSLLTNQVGRYNITGLYE